MNITEAILSTGSSGAVMVEKIKVYGTIVDVFVDSVNAKQGMRPNAIKAIGAKLARAGIQLFIVAPDAVVTAYLKWRTLASINEDPEQTVEYYAELLLEMRRDLDPDTKFDVETAMDLWG
jgi:hypothetical protein